MLAEAALLLLPRALPAPHSSAILGAVKSPQCPPSPASLSLIASVISVVHPAPTVGAAGFHTAPWSVLTQGYLDDVGSKSEAEAAAEAGTRIHFQTLSWETRKAAGKQ